jgi:hypothetical protein
MGWAAEGRIGSAGGYSTPLPASHSSNAVREVGRGRDDCRGVDATHALHFEIGLSRCRLKFRQGPGRDDAEFV